MPGFNALHLLRSEPDLPARWTDPERARGNLEPGVTLLGEPIVEIIDGVNYDWADRLEQHRLDGFFPRSDPPPRYRPAFVRRSLRRS